VLFQLEENGRKKRGRDKESTTASKGGGGFKEGRKRSQGRGEGDARTPRHIEKANFRGGKWGPRGEKTERSVLGGFLFLKRP